MAAGRPTHDQMRVCCVGACERASIPLVTLAEVKAGKR